MLKKIIEKDKRKIEERNSNRKDEEKENYPQEDGGNYGQVATLQTEEGRRCLALILQDHWDAGRERNEHSQVDRQQQQNTHHELDMGFSDVEDVTPPNLVTGFVVANIGNMANSANNDMNSPDTDTLFHVPN